MATPTYSVPIQDFYGGNVSLATSLAKELVINTRAGFRGLDFYCTSDWKLLLTPRIHYVLFYDDTDTSYTDFTVNALDNKDSTDVTLGAMTTADYLYIFTSEVIGGLNIDMSASVNAVTSALSIEYYKSAGWTSVSTSSGYDETDSGGTENANTLGQDGLVTWTAPTDADVILPSDAVNNISGLYGIRIAVTVTLTTNTAINGLVAQHKNTNYRFIPGGSSDIFTFDNDRVGGLQFLSLSGTPTLYINHIQYRG